MGETPRHDRFCLSKWYLDAAGDSGEVFIGYRAALKWKKLEVSYAAALTAGDHEPETRSTVRSEEEPVLRMGSLGWTSHALEVDGCWRSGAAPFERTFYESLGGSVVWRCVMPSARAEVRSRSGVVCGLGYVEHLSMTLPPWRLPIDTLRWGRFLSNERSVVWIDWKTEAETKTWIFVDGNEAPEAKVSEEEISFEGGRLRLPVSCRLLIREGRVSHLLRSLPLPRALSSPALAIHETKWRTRGVFESPATPPVEGWAIHETVRLRP